MAFADIVKTAYLFRDSKGQTARTTFIVGGATAAAVETAQGALKTDLIALSNAHVTIVSRDFTDKTYGTTATFATVEDKAVFAFQDAAGDLHRFQVAAPISSIFLVDTETIDPGNASVQAFVTTMLTSVAAPGSATAALTAYIGGFRARRRLQRKMNVRTLGPGLVLEEPAP